MWCLVFLLCALILRNFSGYVHLISTSTHVWQSSFRISGLAAVKLLPRRRLFVLVAYTRCYGMTGQRSWLVNDDRLTENQ
jgi:hypothetical protein